MKEINKFFNELYKYSKGKIEIRALPSKKRYFVEIDPENIEEILGRHSNNNLFFSVASRDGKGGRKENIVDIPALWLDKDFKNGDLQDEFQKRIAEFPFPPSIEIDSGGGTHEYWVLKEPGNKTDIPRIESLNRRLAVYFNGDLNSCDAAHILRIPGTHNYKYVPPRRVKLVKVSDDEYELSDFESLLPKDPQANYKSPEKADPVGLPDLSNLNQMVEGSGRNTLFVKIGGHLRHLAKGSNELLKILRIFNQALKEPLSEKEILPMWRELCRYEKQSDLSLKERAYQEIVTKQPISATELRQELNVGKTVLSNALSKLIKENRIKRLRNGFYIGIVKREWETLGVSLDQQSNIYIPFLSKMADIKPGEIVVVGGKPKNGKTLLCVNIAHKAIKQRYSVAYGYNESRTRLNEKFYRLGCQLKAKYITEAQQVYEDSGAQIFIIDSLPVPGADYSAIETILASLEDKAQERNCIFIVTLHCKVDKNTGKEVIYGGIMSQKAPSFIGKITRQGEDTYTLTTLLARGKIHKTTLSLVCNYNNYEMTEKERL